MRSVLLFTLPYRVRGTSRARKALADFRCVLLEMGAMGTNNDLDGSIFPKAPTTGGGEERWLRMLLFHMLSLLYHDSASLAWKHSGPGYVSHTLTAKLCNPFHYHCSRSRQERQL